jgi:excisionase family DNA binding protein
MERTETAPTTTHNLIDAAWLDVPAVAREIRASRRSVYRAIRAGQLRAARINGRGDLRVSREWLDDWMRDRAKAI